MKNNQNRFWTKVVRTDDCWIWTACTIGDGYGKFSANGIQYSAHRYSYEIAFGTIPDGLWVCHKCDVPSCVRPDHLFLGTPKENALDCVRKGRRAKGKAHWANRYPERYLRGADHPMAKLDWNTVRQIRNVFPSHDHEG